MPPSAALQQKQDGRSKSDRAFLDEQRSTFTIYLDPKMRPAAIYGVRARCRRASSLITGSISPAGARTTRLDQDRPPRTDGGTDAPMNEPLGVVVAFTSGLFSFLSPCVLPLFPSYLSFVTGMSVSDLSADLTAATRRRVMLHAVAFVVGFSVVFVALGASFSAAGAFLLDYRDWIRRVGGVLIVVFGLYVVGVLRIGIFGRAQQFQLNAKPAGYVGSFIVGLTFAIGWTPCVGPILGAILSLAGTADTVRRGVGLLVAYSAGLGVPFLLSAAALGAFLKFFKRYRPFIPVVERFAGVVLVVVGFLVVTNYYLVLNSWAIALTPDWLLRRL
jgi:cytochrome c-type biogenesis protein